MESSSGCICGKQTELKYGDYIKNIKDKIIEIYNVPNFPCECGLKWYDIDEPISSCTIFAYNNDITKIEYNDLKEMYLKNKS